MIGALHGGLMRRPPQPLPARCGVHTVAHGTMQTDRRVGAERSGNACSRSATDVAEVLERHGLAYAREYQVIVCSGCKHALTSDGGVVNHLRRKHAGCVVSDELVAAVRQLRVAEPGSVEVPPADTLALAYLEARPGFECVVCGYCSPNRETMRKHCTGKHGDSTATASSFRAVPALQAFYRNNHVRWFRVRVPAEQRDEELDDSAARLVDAAVEWLARGAAFATPTSQGLRDEPSAWLRIVGWRVLLRGVPLLEARGFAELVSGARARGFAEVASASRARGFAAAIRQAVLDMHALAQRIVPLQTLYCQFVLGSISATLVVYGSAAAL
jgi:hypothetical protein